MQFMPFFELMPASIPRSTEPIPLLRYADPTARARIYVMEANSYAMAV